MAHSNTSDQGSNSLIIYPMHDNVYPFDWIPPDPPDDATYLLAPIGPQDDEPIEFADDDRDLDVIAYESWLENDQPPY